MQVGDNDLIRSDLPIGLKRKFKSLAVHLLQLDAICHRVDNLCATIGADHVLQHTLEIIKLKHVIISNKNIWQEIILFN